MQNELAGKISDSELEVMKLLWQAGDALPVTEIRETLQRTRGWEATTVKTLVSRLVSKGALRQERRNVFYYSPLRELVAALVRSEGLTQQDIEELRTMFKVED